MYKKAITLSLSIAMLSACGGGSSDGGSQNTTQITPTNEPETPNCVIVLNTISLAHQENCTLTSADADLYGNTAGDISCSNGSLTYGGSQFSSGTNGIVFNGLSIVCSSS